MPGVRAASAALLALLLGTGPRADAGVGDTTLRLPPLSADEQAQLQRSRDARRSIVVGIPRVDARERAKSSALHRVQWVEIEGGRAARWSVISPGAAGLRIGIDVGKLPKSGELRFVGSPAASRILGPVQTATIADRAVYWTPFTEGDTQTVELFIPAEDEPSEGHVAIAEVSHIFTTSPKVEECNLDARCIADQSPALLAARNATARMMMTFNGGFTTSCTGSLLNDTVASGQPWFLSAAHCLAPYTELGDNTPDSGVAATLNTFWFEEAAKCGDIIADSVQLIRGATLILYSDDLLFLRLDEAPPPGAHFAGWDASEATAGTPVTAIHHPNGGLKKLSLGRIAYIDDSALAVQFTRGALFPGSSGSGIWTFDGDQYLVRGTASGVDRFECSPTNHAYYSRFDNAFPRLVRYLAPDTAPFANFSDLWWNPGESGWGLNIIQHESNQLFGVWFTYSEAGKPLWLTMTDGVWIDRNTFVATLFTTSGPAATTRFDATRVRVRAAGSARIAFTNDHSGVFSYIVNGVPGSREIARQPF